MTIPRIIHRVWIDGSPPMPDWMQDNGRKWAELNPGWDVMTWTNHDALTIVNECLYKRPPPHLGTIDRLRYRSDLLRLELLFQYGGLYVDADIEPLRPIEQLVAGHDALAGYSPSMWKGKPVVTNAFLWARRPKHPWIERCISRMRLAVQMYPKMFLAMISGPHHVNRCLKPEDGVTVVEPRVLFPTTKDELKEAYCFHTWEHRRALRKEALA